MSYNKSYYDIADRVAVKMQKEGWRSPKRENVVSTSQVIKLIDLIFENIWEELDEGRIVHVKDKMMLKKIYPSRMKDKYFVQCIDKRKRDDSRVRSHHL